MIDGSENANVGSDLNFRFRMLLKGAVSPILVTGGCDPFGQHHHRDLRFDNESVNRRLPVLDPVRGLDPWC